MATTTGSLTVEQLRGMEAPPGCYLELHNGEPVAMTRPKMKHHKLQFQLQRLLLPLTSNFGPVTSELAFRVYPEHDIRCADVALVSWERWNASDDDLFGAPELVIEVESPSNSAREFKEKAELCLAHGCLEFWTVYPGLRIVEVATPDGRAIRYKPGDRVQSRFTGENSITVDSIFAR